MRNDTASLRLATLLLALSLPAAAQTGPAQPQPQTTASAEGPDVSLPHPILINCLPVFGEGAQAVGPASANPEQATEGRPVIGMACAPAQ